MTTAAELDRRAEANVEACTILMADLIAARKAYNLSIETVARRMGVHPGTVEKFEAYDADPPLSLIRRYALAVNSVLLLGLATHGLPRTSEA